MVSAGALTTVQDLGRSGYAQVGVPHSGALDQPAHRLANLLVGNPADAATLETTVDGTCLRPRGTVTVAVTGAPAPVLVDGRPAPWGAPFTVPGGCALRIGRAEYGVRSYVAFAGGIAVEPVLGSRSTDLLSGLGPAPLTEADVLPLGRPFAPASGVDEQPWSAPRTELVLPIALGPRDDWFTRPALHTLAAGRFRVAAASNRIALRTEGPALERAITGELPSEGLVLGAVQVPPDGQPVIFLADHPTTGGYPVIGVVPEARLAEAAQVRPGTPVRFVPVKRAVASARRGAVVKHRAEVERIRAAHRGSTGGDPGQGATGQPPDGSRSSDSP